MATPKELVQKVAKNTGVPEGTVILHDRNLSNAGLRTEGQRGRGKSAVTFRDAANLLIAVAGSRNVKDSVKTVQEYADLPTLTPMIFDDDGKKIVRGRTFGDAIAALLEAVPSNRHAYDNPEHGSVDIYLYGPVPSARIDWRLGGKADTLIYEQRRTRTATHVAMADLQFIAKFTQITIGHVGEAIADSCSGPGVRLKEREG